MAIALSCILLNVGLGSTLLYSDVEEVEILNNKNTVTSEKELRFNCTDLLYLLQKLQQGLTDQ